MSDSVYSFIPAAGLNFVGGSLTSPMLMSDLYANFPPAAGLSGQYARVSNAYNGVSMSAVGGLDEIFRCTGDGVTYSWVPQRSSNYSVNTSQASGTFNFIPLVTPPNVVFTATPTGAISIAMGTTNAHYGQPFKPWFKGALSGLGISLTGLAGGGTAALILGGYKDCVYTSSGWLSN